MIRKGRHVALIILGVLLLSSLFWGALHKPAPQAVNGVVDLQGKALQDPGVIHLDGEWELYWGQILTPQDFVSNDSERSSELNHILIDPRTGWRSIPQLPDNHGRGVATYRLRIQNLSHNPELALKKTNIRNASRIFVNGMLVMEDGQPTPQLATYIGSNVPRTAFFKTADTNLEIIIQTANFDHFQGGFGQSLMLGDQQTMQTYNSRLFGLELGTSLVLLMIAIIHLLILLLMQGTPMLNNRNNNKLTWMLMVLFFLFAFQNTLINERILYQLIPQLPFPVILASVQISQILLSVLALVSFRLVNSRLLPRFIVKIAAGIGVCLIIFLFTPWATAYAQFAFIPSTLFFISLILVFLRSIWLWIRHREYQTDEKESLGILFEVFLMLTYGLTSMGYQSGYLHDMVIAQVSAIALAIVTLYLHINRLLILYVEKANVDRELGKRRREAINLENDFLRAQINPHFLYNALSVIISLCVQDGEKAARLLANLSTYLRRSFDFQRMTHLNSLESELELLNAYLAIEEARFGERLTVTIEIEPGLEKRQIPPMIIQPLVENAIRHGVLHRERGGSVHIRLARVGERLQLTVADDGLGMPHAKIQSILAPRVNLQHLHTSDSDRQSSGIALQNIVQRLRNQYDSDLAITSEPGQGTTMTILLA
ncbi:MAG: histidine kinase [Eubacteriales bacterium]|nr:histidine kinase [Eubacteriales bacterium]